MSRWARSARGKTSRPGLGGWTAVAMPTPSLLQLPDEVFEGVGADQLQDLVVVPWHLAHQAQAPADGLLGQDGRLGGEGPQTQVTETLRTSQPSRSISTETMARIFECPSSTSRAARRAVSKSFLVISPALSVWSQCRRLFRLSGLQTGVHFRLRGIGQAGHACRRGGATAANTCAAAAAFQGRHHPARRAVRSRLRAYGELLPGNAGGSRLRAL